MAESAEGAEFQAALARILVEPDTRQRFMSDPEGVGQELGLGAEQVEAMKSAGLKELDVFAQSLLGKRVGLLAKVCQATYRLLERQGGLHEATHRFAREHPPRQLPEFPNRTVRDGFWLIDLARRMDADGTVELPHVEDVGRFERIMLTLSSYQEPVDTCNAFAEARQEWPEPTAEEILVSYPRLGAHTEIASFAGPVVDVVGALARGEPLPPEPLPGDEPQLILFAKAPGWRNIHTMRIGPRSRDLLELCDGTRTARQLSAHLLRGSMMEVDPDKHAEGLVGTLGQLYQLNAVTFDRAPGPATRS